MTKQETKTILMARFGMLVCGANYEGTESLQCTTCNLLDNEDHRFYNEIEKIPFKLLTLYIPMILLFYQILYQQGRIHGYPSRVWVGRGYI